MSPAVISCALVLCISNTSFGLSTINESCIKDNFKPYKDLLQKANSFVGDNRTILENHFSDFGFKASEVDQIRSASGEVYCPGTKHNNPAYLSGTIFQVKDELVTSFHGIIDENGVPRDPLSECKFTSQDELSAGLKGHYFDIGDGLDGIARAVAVNHLAVGSADKAHHENDWVVIKLKTAPLHAKPFKLSDTTISLHSCKVHEEYTCQKMIGISAHDHQMPNGVDVPWGKTVVSSFDLYSFDPASSSKDVPSRMFTDRSIFPGGSGGMNFLANSDGTAVRINGALVPVGIVAATASDQYNNKTYSGGLVIATQLVGLDGQLGNAIKKIAGE